ncbi:GNAT family N-acetyltransferase [bacterium]|nr:GNAT family N-acetyltransferase [candidate division CSSED10-310 bacterium]
MRIECVIMGDMKVVFRSAGKKDLDFLWNLKKQAMKTVVEKIYGWDDIFQYNLFIRGFRPAVIRIVQHDGRDIGMVEMMERPFDLFLSRIEILPEFQNRGIGTIVLNSLKAKSEITGKPLRLHVFKVNPAIRLYEKLGFSMESETDTHYQMIFSPLC